MRAGRRFGIKKRLQERSSQAVIQTSNINIQNPVCSCAGSDFKPGLKGTACGCIPSGVSFASARPIAPKRHGKLWSARLRPETIGGINRQMQLCCRL
jgi:hypothetical protein